MKKLSLALFILTFSLGNAQKKSVDTAQVITSQKENAKISVQKPYVILISSDGFRSDYIEKYQAKHLENLAKNGVWAKNGMYPAYPSITFPNHYTIVTGMYPSHHGLVNNSFYDPARKENYKLGSKTVTDGTWYKGMPIWSLAESEGMKAASLFWVGSEAEINGYRPSYYYHYHEEFSGEDKARIVKKWLQLPEEQRPHLITLYFPEVDHNGHEYGPDAKQTEESVHLVDNAIQKLVEELKPLNLPINFVFVSDHGMLRVDEKDYIPMPKIDRDKFIVINSNTFARITAKNPTDVLPLYKELKNNPHKGYRIYLASKFPKRLHYSTREDNTRRIGDIILVPKGKRALVDEGRKPSVGKHGYDSHRITEMKATFIAWGPAFAEPQKIKSFENIHIYPMIAKILGLEIKEPIDGKIEVLDKILK
jgi:predicted AlkP superfamily pyrophosphatase or phosphodiesterase